MFHFSSNKESNFYFFTQLNALIVRVEQEGAEAVGDVVIGQKLQVILTKLKLHGELQVDLKLGKPQVHIKDTLIPTV